jgi:hypothetical protein
MGQREKTQVAGGEHIAPDVITARRKTPAPTALQARFCVELARLGGNDCVAAAEIAGYAPETARKAWRMLRRKPHLRRLVERHMLAEAERAEITETRVILRAWEWLCAEGDEARQKRITPAMQIKALEILARATGLLRGDQHDHKHLHLPGSMGVQFILPTNDRVPVDPAMVIDEGGNGRDRDPGAVPPGAVLELPPLDEPDEQ